MKLSINKILFGLFFVLGVILIPSGVAKADTYSFTYDDRGHTALLELAVMVGVDNIGAHGYVSDYIDSTCDIDISAKIIGENPHFQTIFLGRYDEYPYGGSTTFTDYFPGNNTMAFSGSLGCWNFYFEVPFYVPFPVNPTVTVTADRTSINKGEKTFIRWTSTDATSCVIYDNITNTFTNVGLNSYYDTGPLYTTTTFTVQCFN